MLAADISKRFTPIVVLHFFRGSREIQVLIPLFAIGTPKCRMSTSGPSASSMLYNNHSSLSVCSSVHLSSSYCWLFGCSGTGLWGRLAQIL